MFLSNSIRSASYLLYLILFVTVGCTEKTTRHVYINELPSPIEQQVDTASQDTELKNFQINPTTDNIVSEVETKTEPKEIQKKIHSVWDRLFSLYALPEIKNYRIDREIKTFLKNPKYLTKIQQRAEPYLYFILDEIEKKGLPGELALLPAIESGFKPHAISKSRALGLWQFMPATGRFFGLKQNWWYDGRKDIYESTQAATTYLKQLGNIYHGDWALALASYNAGNGTIRKAIQKNKKKNLATDYWSLSLYKETMDYVPRLLAIATIFANAEQYNIPLLETPNKPYFSAVKIQSSLDLDIAAKMALMSTSDFLMLNPAFKRPSIDNHGAYHLLVHTDKVEYFKSKLAKTSKKDRVKPSRRHKIKSGENLGIIAKNYNTSIYALRQKNNLLSNTIKAGHFLLIPGSSKFSKTLATSKNSRQIYTVKKGDTFWNIARQFSVLSQDIAHWNNISLSKVLQPGQKLIIEES
ncbi:MAG: transglycosylase SLT domain-containing protein [Methylococcales bacterium]|nr:transglycosylase SLT domain-containing protein [Methylococcales bacterium]